MQTQSLFNVKPVVSGEKYEGKIIYETRGKAREYRELACNLYTGCGHKCIYCYAPNVLRRKREVFNEQTAPRKNILDKLRKDAEKYAASGETKQVLFCFTSDPYQPEHPITRDALSIIKYNGLSFCVLTKGGSRALEDIDLYDDGDTFASSLTTLSDGESILWEPKAALPSDRIETLKTFHDAGINTWVSLEPVLDPETVYEIIRKTHSFVDEFKVGVLNYHPLAKEINWSQFAHKVKGLLESLNQPYFLKADLKKYLL